jgi:formate hydrogenlyase subunit 3/multisubunit Na+/H+ antiporter MnhD subunit
VNPLQLLLAGAAALLALPGPAIGLARTPAGRWIVYGGAFALGLAMTAIALAALLGPTPLSPDTTLPLGLPWIGARFHLDALAAAFLVVVNLGGAVASFYALGHGRHEAEPGRVLPFYPAFLAAMNLVVLAADAFTFLIAWEVMSLTSWALVLAHHREPDNRRAAYVYLIMAGFGALSLLLAFGLLAGPNGAYAFEAIRAHPPSAAIASRTSTAWATAVANPSPTSGAPAAVSISEARIVRLSRRDARRRSRGPTPRSASPCAGLTNPRG